MSAIAGIAASGCCCDNPCDCTATTAVTVTWDGSITFELTCEDDGIGGTQYEGSLTLPGIDVLCVQNREPGTCFYSGSAFWQIDLTGCEDEDPITVTVEAYALVSYSTFLGKWIAGLWVRQVLPPFTSSGSCSWHTGGFNNAVFSVSQANAVTSGGTCPPAETYTTSSSCDPGLLQPFVPVTSFTSGALAVS